MKILVVASTFPASDGDPVPAFVKDQVIALREHDASLVFDVLAPHDNRSGTKTKTIHPHYTEHRFHYMWPRKWEKLAGRGIMPALKQNPLNYAIVPFLFTGEFLALLSTASSTKPDIIYAHWFTPQAVNARIVGALLNIPFVLTTHASDVSVWKKIPLFGKLVVQDTARKAHKITAVSTRSMNKLLDFFDEAEIDTLNHKLQIIPMGVPIPEVKSTHFTDNKHVLFIGRLAEKKGVAYLLEAFDKLAEKHPDTLLTIAGDGPLRDNLEAQSKNLKHANRVKFVGYVSGIEKQKLIESHTLYAVPSIITDDGDAEGLPVSLLEGLAGGKLCIATHESGADDILKDGKDGVLVEQKNADALYVAIAETLELNSSKKRAMSSMATQTAKQFAWKTIAEKYYNFFFEEI
ncbi:MAG: Glycosyltransferase [Candidatus Saccharibacteria bacterium GW2011_GWC2_48_9]|nr:MAG: Glycosyltransferase [Candidatus Saccharibacteria bacterium GW2011_GWC2_48_9]HCH34612.1 hypothetical protein [Candidatus Saccharibacteria bacterium]